MLPLPLLQSIYYCQQSLFRSQSSSLCEEVGAVAHLTVYDVIGCLHSTELYGLLYQIVSCAIIIYNYSVILDENCMWH